eukprot:762125-Hanusia_phi.AAC.1
MSVSSRDEVTEMDLDKKVLHCAWHPSGTLVWPLSRTLLTAKQSRVWLSGLSTQSTFEAAPLHVYSRSPSESRLWVSLFVSAAACWQVHVASHLRAADDGREPLTREGGEWDSSCFRHAFYLYHETLGRSRGSGGIR